MNQTILRPIGNGQYTPPQAWRKLLGIDKKPILARLETNRIILEPLEKTTEEWNIDAVSLNALNETTKKEIKDADKAYKKGNFSAFTDHDTVWQDVAH